MSSKLQNGCPLGTFDEVTRRATAVRASLRETMANALNRDATSLEIRYSPITPATRKVTSSGAVAFVATAIPNSYCGKRKKKDGRVDVVASAIEGPDVRLHLKCIEARSVEMSHSRSDDCFFGKCGKCVLPEMLAEIAICESLTLRVLLSGCSPSFVATFDVVRLRATPDFFPRAPPPSDVLDVENAPEKEGYVRALLGSATHVCIVQECLGTLLVNEIRNCESFDYARSLMLQSLLAMRVGWHVAGFRHGDFHMGNVATKKMPPEIAKSDWLFCDVDSDAWWRIPARAHGGTLAKVFDFGRSCAFARNFWDDRPPSDENDDDDACICVISKTFNTLFGCKSPRDVAGADECAFFWAFSTSIGPRALDAFRRDKRFPEFVTLVKVTIDWKDACDFAIDRATEILSGSDEATAKAEIREALFSDRRLGPFVFSLVDVAAERNGNDGPIAENSDATTRRRSVLVAIAKFLWRDFYAGAVPKRPRASVLDHVMFESYSVSTICDMAEVVRNSVVMSWSRASSVTLDLLNRDVENLCPTCGGPVFEKSSTLANEPRCCGSICDAILRGAIRVVSPFEIALQ